jgi:hypothetical protein
MGVVLQAFYWDCPQAENREHQWWSFIKSKLPAIAEAGFTALWLPPANKAASWKSMGYDPYDYYDLGEFDQKGGVPTWFGSKAELLDLIESAHARFRNCARCVVAPALSRMQSVNAGTANAQLTIGSMKPTPGPTIPSVHLISRCAGVCATCATATGSVCELSANAES